MQVDVDSLLNDRPIGALQIRVFVLCALVAMIDAIDSQSIGVAGPLIAKELHMSPAAFSPAFSAGLLGAAIGAFTFGPISDRFGRKPVLVLMTFLFGAFTCITVLANSFPLLVLYRFIAGLGLGGATPCFITLAAEYAPQRSRPTLVSLLWAGYPLGNAVGGFMTSYVVKNFHWSMVFYVGGIPTLILATLLVFLMPESLRFLAARGESRKAETIARRIDRHLPSGPIEIVARMKSVAKIPFRELFADGRAKVTILLGLMLYCAFWTTTVIVLQVPTLFREAGIPLSTSAFFVAVYSSVATFGTAIAGWCVKRVGPLRTLLPAFTGGAVIIASLGFASSSFITTLALMTVLGLTISVANSGVIALAAISFPTIMRSAGTGWVMAMGRFGQVCSPLAVGLMLGLGFAPANTLTIMALAPLLGGILALLMASLASSRAGVSTDASVEVENPA